MPIVRLELVAFRNYEHFVLEPDARLTVLVGPNGAGKTNAVEALQLVTAARSFRRPRWEDLVRWGAAQARVRLDAEVDGAPLETVLDVSSDGTRTYRVNGRPKRKVAEVVGALPSVTFTPDDLDLVKGPSEKRRAAVDDLGEQLSAVYGSLSRDYGRVVRQRNSLLREGTATPAELEPWDEQLVALGSRLLVHRARLLARVAAAASATYDGLASGEVLAVGYADTASLPDGWWTTPDQDAAAEALRAALGNRAGDERARRQTLVGPHRDDVVFAIGGREARAFGSQGQQRTIALAWKLAEVRVIEEVAGRKPALLLDDVMSELDESRRHALMDTVRRDVQTFVTTTNIGYFEPATLETAKVVTLAS